MADPQDGPDEGADATPPAKKAAAKKAPAKKAPAKTAPAQKVPAKKAPAKKVPAKKVPAKKAPAQKAPAGKVTGPPPQAALTAGVEMPALEAPPGHAALPAGTSGAQETRTPPAAHDSFGRGHAIPLSLGLAAAGLVALVLSRFRRN